MIIKYVPLACCIHKAKECPGLQERILRLLSSYHFISTKIIESKIRFLQCSSQNLEHFPKANHKTSKDDFSFPVASKILVSDELWSMPEQGHVGKQWPRGTWMIRLLWVSLLLITRSHCFV